MPTYIGTITATSSSLSTTLSLEALISRISMLIRRDDIDDEIAQWINFAQREISDLVDFPELRITVCTTLVVNQFVYDIPTDYSRADHVYYLDNTITNSQGHNLQPLPREMYSGDTVDFERLLNRTIPESGDPKYFFIDRNGLYVYPAPNKTARLELTYYKIPADLIAAPDVPDISSRFRHYLIWLAYYWGQAFLEKEDITKVTIWEGKFDRVVERVKRLVRRRENVIETYSLPETGMERL